jgi:hypothetical protein
MTRNAFASVGGEICVFEGRTADIVTLLKNLEILKKGSTFIHELPMHCQSSKFNLDLGLLETFWSKLQTIVNA